MSETLTREQVDTIAARAEKATPWSANAKYDDLPVDEYWADNHPDDVEFVAHSRADVPALAATALALMEENEKLRGTIAEFLTANDESQGQLPDWAPTGTIRHLRAVLALREALKGGD